MRAPTALIALGLLAACTGPAKGANAPYVLQPGHIDLERGPDGNTVILDAPQGLVVVDTGRHLEHAQAIIAYARKVNKPVVAVINSHWHLDHSTGNRDILASYPKAELVASAAAAGALEGFLARSRENARLRLADPALPVEVRKRVERGLAVMEDRAALVPAKPVVASTLADLGGRKIQINLARNAATEGDLWLIVPDEGLAIVGDLVVAPVPFFDTGCEQGWSDALAAIDRADWTTLIPGHGAPMDRAAFNRWRLSFERMLDCAKTDARATDCAAGWERDAAGFFTEVERKDVREMAAYYVQEVLRAPADKRMAYCRGD